MINKYKRNWGIGTGWWGEKERHSLARRGFHTGTKHKKQSRFTLYDIPFPHLFTTARIVGKGFVNKKAREGYALKQLKKEGWEIRLEKYPLVPLRSYDVYRGSNYLRLEQSDWKKLKIKEAVIVDKDVGIRLNKIFRKPYPFRTKDFAKTNRG